MGAAFATPFRILSSSKTENEFVMVGLEAAGKTTIMHKLRLGEIVTTTIPTTGGFSVENLEFMNVRIHAWDVEGQDKIRPLLRDYFHNTQALIFVVDSNDRERVVEAKDELHKMLNQDELRDVVVLVFANKKDLPDAMNAVEITEKLGLHSLRQHHWFIQSTCATSGAGLYEGFDWLTKTILTKLDEDKKEDNKSTTDGNFANESGRFATPVFFSLKDFVKPNPRETVKIELEKILERYRKEGKLRIREN